jgi:hypothetical protein
MSAQDNVIPQLPVSCLAEMVDRGRRSAEAILRRFKFKDDKEGHARTIYHPPALAAIRKYYADAKSTAVIDERIDKWLKKATATDKKSVHAQYISNCEALRSFIHDFGKRDLVSVPRIGPFVLDIAGVTFSAPPDFCEKIDGKLRIIKIGFGNKSQTYIDVLLIAIHKAALLRGLVVDPSDAVYFCASTGRELKSRFSYDEMAVTLAEAAHKISLVWPNVNRASSSIGNRDGMRLPNNRRGFLET